MGLRHPESLAAWRRWQRSRQPLRALTAAVRSRNHAGQAFGQLLLPAAEPEVLVVIDSWSPSCQLVIADPLHHLDPSRVAVLSGIPQAQRSFAAERHRVDFSGVEVLPKSVHTVLSLGAFVGLGELVAPWAKKSGKRFVVVQHGLMTPWAPPLDDGDHLLAWSQADARYWSAERASISWQVVGSQLLWQAAHQPTAQLLDSRPVLLGQLHGIELARLAKQQIYTKFCRTNQATYRPHPNEADQLSRLQHQMMRAAGVQFDQSPGSLIDLGRPVVSIFSTGTLEAAQRGLPAWVHHPNPPAWLREFWARYGLSPFHGEPTKAHELPDIEPAKAIAQAVCR